jgi:hypothetical protein
MRDPVTVIEDISRVTDRCYVWSHVFDETHYHGPPRHKLFDPRHPDMELWETNYGRSSHDPKFWGGNGAYARWMRANDMIALFDRHGLKTFDLVPDSASPIAAAISFCARRDEAQLT